MLAILGFAAAAGVLSEAQLALLKDGLSRLAGRDAVVNGVPMAFSSDAVGVLGVALGTRAIAETELTVQIARWAAKFLRNTYERTRTEDWQRCLFRVVDHQLEVSLDLPIPRSAVIADVRIVLVAKGLIDDGERDWITKDEAQTLALAFGQSEDELGCERAALRLAAVEWMMHKRDSAAKGNHGQQSGGGVFRNAPGQYPENRKLNSPKRRNRTYKVIDKVLRDVAASCPSSQEEIFQFLASRSVVLPPAEPFVTARGWMTGFQQNRAAARAWLSKRWAELGLAPLRGKRRRPKT